MYFVQTHYACPFRPCENALTSAFVLEKHEAACKYRHRYSKHPRMNSPATDAIGMINTTKEVFAFDGAKSKNECLENCADDKIGDRMMTYSIHMQRKEQNRR